MHEDDYVRVLHNLGLRVQYFPEIEAWCWRTSQTLWSGAYQTEADALQAMLAYLIEHSRLWLQHILDETTSEQSPAEMPLLSPEAEAEYRATMTKLQQRLQQVDDSEAKPTNNESEKTNTKD